MDVPLSVQLGLSRWPTRFGSIELDIASIHSTSTWAGSFQILEMGRHYEDYVLAPAVVALPKVAEIPAAYPYERLASKIRATGVTGNIGEAIAAIFARRVLAAGLGDIAHVRPRQPFRSRKAPDYLMKIGHLISPSLADVLKAAGPLAGPAWWPVESKARATQPSAATARNEALDQLVSCWSLLTSSEPGAVGYGLIVTFAYQPPREVRASFITPKRPAELVAALQSGKKTGAELTKYLYV